METNENSQQGPQSGERWRKKRKSGHGAASGAYFLGFIGALVYYLQHSTTFWIGVLGILKALVWPALLVYHVLAFLRM